MFLIFYLAPSVVFIGIVGPNNSACHDQASNHSCNFGYTSTQNISSALQSLLSYIPCPLPPQIQRVGKKQGGGQLSTRMTTSLKGSKNKNLIIATLRVRLGDGADRLWLKGQYRTLKHYHEVEHCVSQK